MAPVYEYVVFMPTKEELFVLRRSDAGRIAKASMDGSPVLESCGDEDPDYVFNYQREIYPLTNPPQRSLKDGRYLGVAKIGGEPKLRNFVYVPKPRLGHDIKRNPFKPGTTPDIQIADLLQSEPAINLNDVDPYKSNVMLSDLHDLADKRNTLYYDQVVTPVPSMLMAHQTEINRQKRNGMIGTRHRAYHLQYTLLNDADKYRQKVVDVQEHRAMPVARSALADLKAQKARVSQQALIDVQKAVKLAEGGRVSSIP
jgi:hypothetical protein